MESAMVPSFLFLRLYAFPAIQGTANGTVPPPDQTHSPNSQPIPVWSQYIQRTFCMKGVLSQLLQNCFSEKWKTFSPLENVSNEKRGKSICPNVRQNYFLRSFFRFADVNTHHSSEILTNYPGAIQNKLPSTDKENSVQLTENTAQFLYE